MDTLADVCKGAPIDVTLPGYMHVADVLHGYNQLFYSRPQPAWDSVVAQFNELPKDKVFYYIARIPIYIDTVLKSLRVHDIPPRNKWPSNLFNNISDVNVNALLTRLDEIRYDNGNNLGRYMRGLGECRGCSELRKEVDVLSTKVQVNELWNELLGIEDTSTATKLVSEAEAILAGAAPEVLKRLSALAAIANEQRLVHVLFLLR